MKKNTLWSEDSWESSKDIVEKIKKHDFILLFLYKIQKSSKNSQKTTAI